MIVKDVQKYVQRYLEATQSEIIEKSNHHIKVKLSPMADKELTNRPFYWSFVERSNEKPETLSFCFIFDPVKYEQQKLAEEEKLSQEEQLADSILERTFGIVAKPLARVQQEHLYFGSPRLEQIFQSTKTNGRFVCMFEEPKRNQLHPLESKAYTTWLGINFKVEYCCDRKREEQYCLGISLVTGYVKEQFYEQLAQTKLTPKLPSNVHITKHDLSYLKAVQVAENYVERKLKQLDYSWAKEANQRLHEELERIARYYEPLLQQQFEDEQQGEKIRQQYEQRKVEIRWQFEPRVQVTVTNCGLFHLEGID